MNIVFTVLVFIPAAMLLFTWLWMVNPLWLFAAFFALYAIAWKSH